MKETFSTTSILMNNLKPNANALKHTHKYGEHVPLDPNDYPLIASEISELCKDKIGLRKGDQIPVSSLCNRIKETVYIEINSQTSINCFREIGFELNINGTCTVTHVFGHNEKKRYNNKIEHMNQKKYFYTFK